ncbi:MAG: nucleotidyl transferase AbiEii/AbiGii toxin family protein [Candidatus Brocadiia bacterium]
MKPLRTRLEEARARLGIRWETLERDYVLSWMLAGIARVNALKNAVVFKGGTALKKCYFGRYRFSEDLDFSGVDDVPTGDDMEEAVLAACDIAGQLLDVYAPVDFECERYTEQEPHPAGQEAFTIRAALPWHRSPHVRVMVEVSVDEPVLRPAPEREVLHDYGEPLETQVRVYSLEEIIAEKLRAILQHVEKLRERGWSRSRARDFYDLWRVLNTYRDALELSGFETLLRRKCEVRNVTFDCASDFFHEPMLRQVKRTWKQWLGPLVADLPAFDTVIGQVRSELPELLAQPG